MGVTERNTHAAFTLGHVEHARCVWHRVLKILLNSSDT